MLILELSSPHRLGALNKAVNRLREALNDDAGHDALNPRQGILGVQCDRDRKSNSPAPYGERVGRLVLSMWLALKRPQEFKN